MCSCLKTCTVALDREEFESTRIVELPHLERLEVTFTGVTETAPFFDSLYLPNLKELRIEIAPEDEELDDDPFPLECVAALQRRSKFDLQHLSMISLDIDIMEIFSFFTLIPNLQYICLKYISGVGSEEFLTALIYDKDQEILLPKLTEMSLTVSLNEVGIPNCLDKMIRSRLTDLYGLAYGDYGDIKNHRPVVELRVLELEIRSDAFFTEAELQLLEMLTYEGLQYKIICAALSAK